MALRMELLRYGRFAEDEEILSLKVKKVYICQILHVNYETVERQFLPEYKVSIIYVNGSDLKEFTTFLLYNKNEKCIRQIGRMSEFVSTYEKFCTHNWLDNSKLIVKVRQST